MKELRTAGTIAVEPVLDRDTHGIPGAPDISTTIFDKIERCTAMVADVTIVGHGADSKPSAEITAAYQDWIIGVPAQQLRRTHIRNYARLSQWRRDKKARALMTALRSMRRRDSNRCLFPRRATQDKRP